MLEKKEGFDELRDHLLQVFRNEYELDEFFQAITNPEKIFTLRVNLAKTSRDTIISLIRENNENVELKEGPTPNTIILAISGPFDLEKRKKKIECDRFAAESVMVGADLFLPGVKNIWGKVKKNDVVGVYLQQSDIIVAEGIVQMDAKDIGAHLRGICVKNAKSLYSTPKFREFIPNLWDQGFYTDHSVIPILAVYDLVKHYKPGMRILDLCSAPGNKTTAISEIIYEKWGIFPEIIAIDKSKNRCEATKQTVKRLGLENITIIHGDLVALVKQKHELIIGTGDIVLFDPSCSALGKRPRLVFDKNYKNILNFASNQSRLLKYAAETAKSGGIFMYNTCTITIEENENICEEIIQKYGFEPLQVEIPSKLHEYYDIRAGIEIDGIKNFSNKFIRFLPAEEFGESYFIAKFKKG